MSGNESARKKFKRPKKLTASTTNPSASAANTSKRNEEIPAKPACPLAAKDSEWVDILQTPIPDVGTSHSDEEELLLLVDCEESLQTEPLAVMFPGLQENPDTLEKILSKNMSTTEVTKHLVDLGKKADFTFMKKSSRLIPPEKQWLDGVPENCDTQSSAGSTLYMGSSSSFFELESEATEENDKRKKIRKNKSTAVAPINLHIGSTEVLDESSHSETEHAIDRDRAGVSNQNQTRHIIGAVQEPQKGLDKKHL